MKIVPIALLLMLSGCAYTGDTTRLADNKFQVYALAAPVRGGAAGARSRAVADASEKCQQEGKQLEILDVQTGYSFPANGTATVTFTCK